MPDGPHVCVGVGLNTRQVSEGKGVADDIDVGDGGTCYIDFGGRGVGEWESGLGGGNVAGDARTVGRFISLAAVAGDVFMGA